MTQNVGATGCEEKKGQRHDREDNGKDALRAVGARLR